MASLNNTLLILTLTLSLLSLPLPTSSRNHHRPSPSLDLISFSFTTLSLDLNHPFSPDVTTNPTDVHDLLPQYGLPKGLLPNNVNSYTLSSDGAFMVELKGDCYVHFADKHVYYDRNISGKLRYGAVVDVEGIQAKKLFVWVPVTGIEADPRSETIEFFAGFVSEKLPVAEFEEIPVCGSRVEMEESSFLASM